MGWYSQHPSHIRHWWRSSLVLSFGQGGRSIEHVDSRISRNTAQAMERRLHRVDRQRRSGAAMGGSHGNRSVAAAGRLDHCHRRARGYHGRGTGASLRVAHSPRRDRTHLGAGDDQRPRTVPPGARHRCEPQCGDFARCSRAGNPDGSIRARDIARRDGFCHGADDSRRYIDRGRSRGRFARAAHRAGRPRGRPGHTRSRRPARQADFHRLSPRQNFNYLLAQ